MRKHLLIGQMKKMGDQMHVSLSIASTMGDQKWWPQHQSLRRVSHQGAPKLRFLRRTQVQMWSTLDYQGAHGQSWRWWMRERRNGPSYCIVIVTSRRCCATCKQASTNTWTLPLGLPPAMPIKPALLPTFFVHLPLFPRRIAPFLPPSLVLVVLVLLFVQSPSRNVSHNFKE